MLQFGKSQYNRSTLLQFQNLKNNQQNTHYIYNNRYLIISPKEYSMQRSIIIFVYILTLISFSIELIDILAQGAVSHVDTLASQFQNSKIITNSILKANLSSVDRTVRIPRGHTFYSMPIVLHNIYNVTIIIEGKLSASKYIRPWPKKPNSAHYQDFIYISDSQKVQICGGGRIDGRGYHWWMVQWMRLKKLRPLNSQRPQLINIDRCSEFKIHDLILKNSPMYHIRTWGSFHFDIYNLAIKVNTTAQFSLTRKFTQGLLPMFEGIVPMFPLNTDGIDPAGKYFHIWNLTVQNYDDVVVPKPSHKNQIPQCDCSEHMLIENITIRLGVGLSIGSVPPNSQHNCLRNITFRNAYFDKPFKAIYLKTNPGSSGSGEIKDILYENMIIREPIWWAIYLGPQQQKQPLGGGPGCMLYPFDPRGTSQTQPLIDIRNVTLSNIKVYNSLLFPIVLRCNETNPCTDINLNNVVVDHWHIGKKKQGYVCQNVKGKQQGGYPTVPCLHQDKTNYIRSFENNNNEEKTANSLSKQEIQQWWNRLQATVSQIGYQQQDDQMNEHNQSENFWLDLYNQYMNTNK